MMLGATENIFVDFNFYEALFWMAIGIGVFIATRPLPNISSRWRVFATLNMLLFGVTDVVELYTGGFIHTATWLLYWKLAHVCGLILSLGTYLWLRIQ